MSKNQKLNVVLAITDELGKVFKRGLDNYSSFFREKQGAFKGFKKTYTPFDGTIDEPNKRGLVDVVTTVKEKLDYFEDVNSKYIDSLFSLEKTNSSGVASAELIVDGESWGIFSSLELLRLKSFIDSPEFVKVYENLPVRSDTIIWNKSSNTLFSGRDVFETELVTSVSKTTEKENYILEDPNIANGRAVNYTPQVATKTTIKELGTSTSQEFSGEITQRQKALILKKRSDLSIAVTEALKKANEAIVIESEIKSKKIFGFLHSPIKITEKA